MTDSFLPFQDRVEPVPVNHDQWKNFGDWRPGQFRDPVAESKLGLELPGGKLAQPGQIAASDLLTENPTAKWRAWESNLRTGQDLNFARANDEYETLTCRAGANWREGALVGVGTIGADYAGMWGAQALGCDRNSATYRFFQPKGYDTGLAFGAYLGARAFGASAPLALGAAFGGWAIGHTGCLSEFQKLMRSGSWFSY